MNRSFMCPIFLQSSCAYFSSFRRIPRSTLLPSGLHLLFFYQMRTLLPSIISYAYSSSIICLLIPSIECLLFFFQLNVFFLPPYAYSSSSITCLLLSLPLNAYSSSFSRMSSSYHHMPILLPSHAYSSPFH